MVIIVLNTLLSWKALIPLSRLTYCTYLVHPLVIWWLVATTETLNHYSIQLMIMIFAGEGFKMLYNHGCLQICAIATVNEKKAGKSRSSTLDKKIILRETYTHSRNQPRQRESNSQA